MSISRIQITASPFRHFFVVKARRSNQTVHHFPRNPFQIGVFSQKFRFPICSEYVNKVPFLWSRTMFSSSKFLMMILWIPENCVHRFYFRFMPTTKKESIPLDTFKSEKINQIETISYKSKLGHVGSLFQWESAVFSKEDNSRHLDPPTNAMDTGQPVIFLTGQDVFIF